MTDQNHGDLHALLDLEQGLADGFDLALSWEAPVDHAFLSPVNTLHGTRPIPPLVPIFVNAFVAPQPTARRCFAFGQHIGRVVARGPWNVGIIATGGLSHFPELSLPRVGETDTVFDRKLIHWMERGEHGPLQELTADELHKTGSHEFLNWMVLLGTVTPARAQVRYFGELPRINMAAVELDDHPGKPRDVLAAVLDDWRASLERLARTAVEEGHFRSDVDPAQFCFDLYGIVLSTYLASRMMEDQHARERAAAAFERLIQDSRP